MPPLRVLLADDHTILRQGLLGILRTSPDFEIVAEAGNGHDAVERALATRPDVAVLDITMPRLSGLEAARRIRKLLPRCRILVLTMHDENEFVLKMVRAGVAGYLVKDGAAAELLTALKAVGAGRSYFGAQATRALADVAEGEQPLPEDPLTRLTEREREVLHLLIEGKTNAQVAGVLCISPKTVDNHRTHLMEKLGVHSAAELLRFAARHGLLA
jgi:DNA-binding NarL/FixJ family response regulator